MKRKKPIDRLKQILRNSYYSDIQVVLFGSEARGDARPDSDIDLLVIVDRDNITESERQEIVNPLFGVEFETGILINPIVVLKKQWEGMVTPFQERVMKEGVVL
ncbi:putative nucleotidyltransferase [Parabacteroides sp. PFB2-12]|uniref:nucleotidyltransferase domain-containing protein n=1 Tax=unclassified Parabacteroides TaxID=2649774 RepID=UPI0024764283|nr:MULTISPECIES: nucleotidyltransferase domain-containing protein [unclassified Parabacteroides]MDH6342583.1 putative nucleotidyltransferase [Parabacteroides sp. PM6-13]MDH6390235.1 putative nucleotidyltransferase [Parabacteroides sp. PFB2-12]